MLVQSLKRQAIVLWIVFMIVAIPMASALPQSEFPLKTGPFIDRLVFKTDAIDMDEKILNLLNNEVDVIGTSIPASLLPMLEGAESIETTMTANNAFGYIAFNTAKYPMNLSVFRRALAVALDKNYICEDIWDGLAVPQDAPLPSSSVWSAESYLDEHYYIGDVNRANQMLDDAGFLDIDADGWREAPDGSNIALNVECPYSDTQLQVAEVVQASLNFMNIETSIYITEWNEYLTRLNFHGVYDIAFLEEVPETYDVSWLATNFHSGWADIPHYNIPNFRNATYDSYFDQMIYSTDYNQVRDAAIEMQKILTYECPIIVCYVSSQISVYRTNMFTDFVNDFGDGIGSWWSYYKARLKNSEEIHGGTLRVAGFGEPPSFNFMVNPSPLGWDSLGEIYDTLTRLGPDGDDLSWIAESYTIQTHLSNPEITDGFTRLTFNIVRNATWSDGVPLTALDVAFSLNYYRDCVDDNPYAVGLQDLMAAYASGVYEVIVEFGTESYWHLHTVGLKPIIPYHIFFDIGIDGWNTWDPEPPDATLVGSGPFMYESYVPNDFIDLVRNPDYFRHPVHVSDSTTTTTTTTSTPTTATTTPEFDNVLLGNIAFLVGMACIPITVGAIFLRKSRENQ